MAKIIMSDGGHTDTNYSNHNLRITTVTRLFDLNMDTTLIKNQTGHRSNAVDGYKRISDAQQHAVSMMLRSGMTRQTKTETVVSKEPFAKTDDVADDTDTALKPDVSIHLPGRHVIHVHDNMNIYIWVCMNHKMWTGRSHWIIEYNISGITELLNKMNLMNFYFIKYKTQYLLSVARKDA